ncbi:MAG: hypothetical protein AAB459_01275 [Patescibacteria group bacterium]
MIDVCPTITATDLHEYRKQMELVEGFATRIHIDCMDGDFTPTKSPDLSQAWWSENVRADIHFMYRYPLDYLDTLIRLKPKLVIVQAEAEGNFRHLANQLHKNHIKVGVCILPETDLIVIKPALSWIDHVLIFSGKLGYHGGVANLGLLSRAETLKKWKSNVELGWDGGINENNAKQLITGGISVLNVGGGIHSSGDPAAAYRTLLSLTDLQ